MIRLLFIVWFVFSVLGAISQKNENMVIVDGQYIAFDAIEVANINSTIDNPSQIDSLIAIARDFIGVRYSTGGCSSKGFDCSGFLQYSCQKMGISIARTSKEQAKMGEYVEADSLQAGDFIFFNGHTIASKTIGHVALVTEVLDGAIKIIHATSSRGVMEEELTRNSYFMQRWVYNKRIID